MPYTDFDSDYMARADRFATSRQWMRTMELVVGIIKDFKSFSHLDVGCNSGHLVNLIMSKIPDIDVVGIDVNRAAIEKAMTLSNAVCIHGIASKRCPYFIWYNGSKLPPFSVKFDTISCCYTLPHVDDPISLLRGIRSIMSDRSRLIVTIPNPWFDVLMVPWNLFARRWVDRTIKHVWHLSQFQRLLGLCGMHIMSLEFVGERPKWLLDFRKFRSHYLMVIAKL